MSKHTPTPWTVDTSTGVPVLRKEIGWDEKLNLPTVKRIYVAQMSDEDRNRILTCLNACDRFTNEQIEELSEMLDEGTLAIMERDELLKALEEITNVKQLNYLSNVLFFKAHDIAERTLAKIKGGNT